MTESKFLEFWCCWSANWYNGCSFTVIGNDTVRTVKDLCRIKDNYGKNLFKIYTEIKKITKECYFKDPKKKKLNRYKRAAVIAYAIIKSEPLEYL